ncbi:transcriptional enhancer factor TEF-4 isoform B [Alligator mississippiensis]|uniref:Transcriptional enhancer factor TEF-4 isoform B n=1 Tax=Alligator mississippiensis TaxID=8496 RepID=A0A151NK21_ALLMI|nr:transcriptional enhancer factor TEF-4 isoform B [Alligator mississippiensis]
MAKGRLEIRTPIYSKDLLVPLATTIEPGRWGEGDSPPSGTGEPPEKAMENEAEGVWSPDIEQSFQEALAVYPPCGRRKIILSDEGKMYGVQPHPGPGTASWQPRYPSQGTEQYQSQIQQHVDQVSKDKALQSIAAMSSAQLVSATGLQDKLGVPSFTHRSFPPSPGSPEFFQFWPGDADQTRPNQDVKPYPVPPAAASLAVPACPLGFEVPMPPVPSPAVWPGHCIGSPHLCLVEFSVFVELPAEPETFKQHLFVHIGSSPPHPADPPLEAVDVRQIYDKFPEKTGGLRDLYEQGPSNAFFLVKFWADLSAPLPTEPGAFYGVSSKYEGPEPLAITCAHKVCSFGKQVVERVETELGHLEDGRYVFRLLRFPLCEYLVNFVHKLQQLPEKYMMDSVLENFTVLQVVRNRDSQELLLCMAFVFEVSANKRGAQHHVYRLVKD